MTRKIYRTAQGKMVDLGRLQLQNENTRAVGNMGVNARGDKVDSFDRPIERRPAQVQRQYNRQTGVVGTDPTKATISPPAPPAPVKSARPSPPEPVDIPESPEDFQDDFEKQEDAQPVTGLAAAIAKAREIRQDPLRTPKDTARHQEGMKKS